MASNEGELRATFNEIDTDRGGSLDAGELEQWFLKTLFKNQQ
jgi:hypothetical protein